MRKRLIIVSNRLPLTVDQNENEFILKQSSGGLTSAISAYLGESGHKIYSRTVWAGVPGCDKTTWEKAYQPDHQQDYTYLPIIPDEKKYEIYYGGFSNSVIWPLFHYFPSFVDYNISFFQAYTDVNEFFAEALAKEVQKNDVVWIHDYHLLPLAARLRKKIPSLTIGFFLHIPFPSYELFRVLPKEWQNEILTGMLGADLIGFHTAEYASHFLACIEKTLKLEHDEQHIFWDKRQVKVNAFPISINFALYNSAYTSDSVSRIRKQYQDLKGNRKLLFSVDRLDYSKGIINRLKGYELFLKDNPEYMDKVQFALVIVPSRDSISKYAERKKIIDEYIGNLNSKLGNIQWQPVLYQYNHLSFDELIALYTACDIALITPLRDGMNLVSKEFVASRMDKKGVLILSEMAGAAKELHGALLINPNDTREIAAAIRTALEMKVEEQQVRITSMQKRIKKYDVTTWATDFLEQLKKVKELQQTFEIKFLDSFTKFELIEKYSASEKRLLLLDYDGSLVPFSKLPCNAEPGRELLDTLLQLSMNPQNDVFIISGRDSEILEQWMGHLPLGLIAEHGAKIRNKKGEWTTEAVAKHQTWRKEIEKTMQQYVDECPESFLEQKEYSIAWHYRNTDLIQGATKAKELYEELLDQKERLVFSLLNGKKVIEAKATGVNKGIAVDNLINSFTYDFILAIGDDITDEDMFKRLMGLPQAHTIKVGDETSFAKYNLYTPYMVQSLLQNIAVYTNKKLVDNN